MMATVTLEAWELLLGVLGVFVFPGVVSFVVMRVNVGHQKAELSDFKNRMEKELDDIRKNEQHTSESISQVLQVIAPIAVQIEGMSGDLSAIKGALYAAGAKSLTS